MKFYETIVWIEGHLSGLFDGYSDVLFARMRRLKRRRNLAPGIPDCQRCCYDGRPDDHLCGQHTAGSSASGTFKGLTIQPIQLWRLLDGSTPYGEIINAGHVVNFTSQPKVAADPDRRSLLRTEFISEFFTTTSGPVGHVFNLVPTTQDPGLPCHTFFRI